MAIIHDCVNLVQLCVGYGISAFYGVCFLYSLASRLIRNPSDCFWSVKQREVPPACLNDPALGNHVYIQIKNVKLHYVEKGDKSKPLMLCLHGFPEFWYSWRHQLKEFSTDYWVVAVDMRGYGDSEKPLGRENYRLNHLVDDVKNLIDGLGREKCTLVAHDWGGIVTWFFTLQYPQYVDSYVIMNSTHPLAFKKILKKSWEQFRKSWYVFFFQLPFLPELSCRMDDLKFVTNCFSSKKSPSQITEEDIEAYKFSFGKPGAFTHAINYYRANFMLNSKLDSLGKAEDFPPGLVLFGDEDNFLLPELQEESVKCVVNAKLSIIKGANHFVQQDDPEAVNKELRQFFNEVKAKQK